MKSSIIFITGMSGSGKSTVLKELASKGYTTIDTDIEGYCSYGYDERYQEYGWLWKEDKINVVVNNHQEGVLLIAGTVSNQGKFYSYFDEIIYLSAPLSVLLARVQRRTNNRYGQTDEEKKTIQADFEQFDAMIKTSATTVIDATKSLDKVVKEVESIIASTRLKEK